MARKCPKCGLVTRGTSRCACGYEFATGRVVPPSPGRIWVGRVVRLLAGCAGTAVGAVIGVVIAVPLRLEAAARASEALREEGKNACGLIVVGPMFEGLVLGTVLGGSVGLIASVLLMWLVARLLAGPAS